MPEPTPSALIVDNAVHVPVSRPQGPGEAFPFVDIVDIPPALRP